MELEHKIYKLEEKVIDTQKDVSGMKVALQDMKESGRTQAHTLNVIKDDLHSLVVLVKTKINEVESVAQKVHDHDDAIDLLKGWQWKQIGAIALLMFLVPFIVYTIRQ